ncbi:hypothetical protein [Azospirillum doebereinerae]
MTGYNVYPEWDAKPSQLTNTYKTNNQNYPSVAVMEDDSSVVVWISAGQDGSQEGIYGQRFDAAGNKVGAEFRVNTNAYGQQYMPSVTALEGGGFVVGWHSNGSNTSSYDVCAQRFDTNGQAVGSEFIVNSVTAKVQSYVSLDALQGGGFVAVWESVGQDDPGDVFGMGIYGQRFDANGVAVGGEFQVNVTTVGDQRDADVTVLNNGNIAVTWFDATNGAMARLYDSSGTALTGELDVDAGAYSHTANVPLAIDALQDGGFVIAHEGLDGNGRGVLAQRFDASGNKVGPEFWANSWTTGRQAEADVLGLADGGFLISWTSEGGQDGDAGGVYGQRYDAAGQTLGGEFRINEATTGQQAAVALAARGDGGFVASYHSQSTSSGFDVYTRLYDGNLNNDKPSQLTNTYKTNDQNYPSVAVMEDKSSVVVWISAGQDGSQEGIYGQRFDAAGNKVGAEFRVNTNAYGQQYMPSVTALEGGGFVVGWHSNGSNTSSYDVCAQRFDANGQAVGSEFIVNSVTAKVQSYVSLDALQGGGFVAVWESVGQDDPGDVFGMGIYGQRFDANGVAVGGEFQVNVTTVGDQRDADVTVLNNGNIAVTWFDATNGAMARLYDSSGTALTGELDVDAGAYSHTANVPLAIDALQDGGFVIAHEGLDGNGRGVLAQRFDASGNKVGPEFWANSWTTGRQAEADVLGLADGGFLISWTSEGGQDGDAGGVYGQRYDAAGQTLGGEFRINEATTGQQAAVALAARSDGGFVASYHSQSILNGYDVYSRFFGY